MAFIIFQCFSSPVYLSIFTDYPFHKNFCSPSTFCPLNSKIKYYLYYSHSYTALSICLWTVIWFLQDTIFSWLIYLHVSILLDKQHLENVRFPFTWRSDAFSCSNFWGQLNIFHELWLKTYSLGSCYISSFLLIVDSYSNSLVRGKCESHWE